MRDALKGNMPKIFFAERYILELKGKGKRDEGK